jgi:hypothetical protein
MYMFSEQIAPGMIYSFMESLVASPKHDQLIMLYRNAMAAYVGAVDAVEDSHGKDRLKAQARVVRAHMACENAWQAVMRHQPGLSR